MRVYADTSFILKLLVREPDTEAVAATYRSLGNPPLVYSPIHSLEVQNSIYQRAFYLRKTAPTSIKPTLSMEKASTLRRLDSFIERGALQRITIDLEVVVELALDLARKHTERMGGRAIDVLHVASALYLHADLFLTQDKVQEKIANAAGLRVRYS